MMSKFVLIFHFYVQSPDVFRRPDAADAAVYARPPARPSFRVFSRHFPPRRGAGAGATPTTGERLRSK